MTTSPSPFTLLNTEEAAALLGISRHTLEDWRWKRLGPPWIRITRSCVRYDLDALRQWLSEHTIEEIPVAS
jgi:predicted DNA-binding transcriptional regulator AlpA